jgi:FtsZ-interacting cell division protein ZipA
MNTLITIVLIIVISIGIIFSIWSIINTRKKYYNDFIKKREERKKEKYKGKL